MMAFVTSIGLSSSPVANSGRHNTVGCRHRSTINNHNVKLRSTSSTFINPLSSITSTSTTTSTICINNNNATTRHTTPPQCSDMGLSFASKKFDKGLRIGVISTRWNTDYVSILKSKVISTLRDSGTEQDNIVEMEVPGAFELPMAARLMCAAQKVDAVICLGVLIKGDTDHYDHIAEAVSGGLMDLQLTLSTPMVFGVLCCRTKEQVEVRTTGDKCSAQDWAKTALEMGTLKNSQLGGVSAGKKSVGFF